LIRVHPDYPTRVTSRPVSSADLLRLTRREERIDGASGSCSRRRSSAPHTQRGNARRFILQDEADRKVYLDLLRQSTELHGMVGSFGVSGQEGVKKTANVHIQLLLRISLCFTVQT
jgi:hypothetical protein